MDKVGHTCPFWTEAETAYIAGIMNGEGTMGVYPRRKRWKGKNKGTVVTSLAVVNTKRELLIWLAGRFGVEPDSYIVTQVPDWRTSYSLHIQRTATVLEICRRIPYLIVKREQARLMIQFCEWRLARMKKPGRSDFSDKDTSYLLSAMTTTRILNKRAHRPELAGEGT